MFATAAAPPVPVPQALRDRLEKEVADLAPQMAKVRVGALGVPGWWWVGWRERGWLGL